MTQSGPSTGSCVPSTRLPPYGRPTELAWCQAIVGAVSARAVASSPRCRVSRPGGSPIVVRSATGRPVPTRNVSEGG